ncbi:cytochrome c maturation protein CcmE [Pikeienuella piscinae]|uniref:Cytochrome c-type biogenesis protein CcmE n=2 Tax=Pikeienuella piscinae TaxID=2748098 RepID=A0A7M3T6Y0_9RHOB|nr:cytochrome c maturation protein CcmE [Pikeienuella piscinae]
MTRRSRRMALIGVGAGLMAAAAVLVSVAFKDTIAFFVTPTELAAAPRGPDERLRIGGMVVEGSLQKGVVNHFRLTDFETEVEVRFEGVLPDLIKPGQGAVADGRMVDGVFVASEVLAKHDEKYMPAEIEERVMKAKEKVGS